MKSKTLTITKDPSETHWITLTYSDIHDTTSYPDIMLDSTSALLNWSNSSNFNLGDQFEMVKQFNPEIDIFYSILWDEDAFKESELQSLGFEFDRYISIGNPPKMCKVFRT
jgi:hypothetical protein